VSIQGSFLFDARFLRRDALRSVMDLLKRGVVVNYLWKWIATLGLLLEVYSGSAHVDARFHQPVEWRLDVLNYSALLRFFREVATACRTFVETFHDFLISAENNN